MSTGEGFSQTPHVYCNRHVHASKIVILMNLFSALLLISNSSSNTGNTSRLTGQFPFDSQIRSSNQNSCSVSFLKTKKPRAVMIHNLIDVKPSAISVVISVFLFFPLFLNNNGSLSRVSLSIASTSHAKSISIPNHSLQPGSNYFWPSVASLLLCGTQSGPTAGAW